MKHQLSVILILITMVLGYGCEGQKEEDVNTAAAAAGIKTTSVGVKASLDAGSSSRMLNALGTADEIVAITVNAVLAADDSALTSTILDNSEGVWQGTLTTLPYDVSIKFIAQAQDADNVTIFTGTLTQTLLEGSNNDITISLSSVDDGLQPDNPVIASITMPEKILVDSDPQLVTLQINHGASVEYTINVSSGGLAAAFGETPAASLSGVHDPSGTLQFFFTAPSSAGVAELTVTIRELNSSDEVGANFYLTIVSFDPDTWTDSDITVVVGPAITDMAFVRSATTLKVSVTTDPGTGLTYEWTGTGDFAALNQTGNPIFITGFNDTLSGEIRVTATDTNNLQAFVVRSIQVGDYPYTVNEYITDMPGLYIYDETTQLMWQDNTNKVNRKWNQAVSVCSDLNLAGYTVWRLPTKNELVNMFDRKDNFSNYYTSEYWSADEDPNDSARAITVSYDDASETSQAKTRRKLVRCVKD